MEYRYLGKTDIKVSRLAFGSLTITPSQANLSVDEGARLIEYAYDKGVNFIDTAELYDNYEYIRPALEHVGRRNMIITTKSYAYDAKTAEKSLMHAMNKLNTDYIDIFLLHEQESIHTLKGHYEAVEYFLKKKKEGLIRAFGISTHKVAGAKAFNKHPELDIIHPMFNYKGLGILDGSRDQMKAELELAHMNGKGIYAMKVLGGGHLIPDIEEAVNYVRQLDFIDSIAIGMKSFNEVDCNISLVEKGIYPKHLSNSLKKEKRKLIIADYCRACGECERVCKADAIKVINGRAVANQNCILCGYCANYCPDFCIKVI